MASISGGLSRMATLSPPAVQHSQWHSPMPYLFGGLAAMLGLIAFALLILACSYWKLSTTLISNSVSDLETGDHKLEASRKEEEEEEGAAVFEEKVVVIMAGDVKPTFLATPIIPLFSKNVTHQQQQQQQEEEEEKKSIQNNVEINSIQ